ncbi:MAG: hypothetical protein LKM32_12445 [Chiayiivirga sp.]|jgi:hypothetical protein|uniref:hypothetical protein n=1 Tax=Chiayiivirga sp. TaxID=2041042 RepID=UPI0025C2C4DD|nr:hypothetical protein [Chiayiivirga sp.]MCI1730148.1 hypothetical protein [Chiayiivirga sp.]
MRVRQRGVLGLCLAAWLGGCGSSVDGVDRADQEALGLDAYGCPDLSGTYAFRPPGERDMNFRGSILEPFESQWRDRVKLRQLQAVTIRRLAAGQFEFRFVKDADRVLEHLALIREYEKPRYRQLYHLAQDRGRAAFLEHRDEAAYARQLADLGPTAEEVRDLRVNIDFHCRKGWLDLPRQYTDPIRLTLGADRSLIGESDEISTYGVPVWCGDGCKEFPIPTGTYTGTLHWPRDDRLRPWVVTTQQLLRPLDELEQEQRDRQLAQAEADGRRYRVAGDIRVELEKLAPQGVVVEAVEVIDGQVNLRYRAPKDDPETLLRRVRERFPGGLGPQQVETIFVSSRPQDRSVRFVMTDTALVLRGASRPAANATAASARSPSRSAERREDIQPVVPVLAAVAPPPEPVDADAIRAQLGAVLPHGVTVERVGGQAPRISFRASAPSSEAVSQALRALDRVGAQPELLEMSRSTDGSYRCRILLRGTLPTRG